MVQRPRIQFLGLAFDPLHLEAAVRRIALKARQREPMAYVVTPNVDHAVRLDRTPDLSTAYRGAWLTLCDSRILHLLGKLSGLELPVAPGSDIVRTLLETEIAPGETVIVIGGSPRTVEALKERYGLRDVRWFDAPRNLRNDPAARAACTRFMSDNPGQWIFLAVGSPQQEVIALEAAQQGGATGVAVCCGASLKFLSGEEKRAPEWMQRAGLEWAFRLIASPARMWRRYLLEGPRVFGLWLRWLATAR